MSLKLKVVTPEKVLLETDAQAVYVDAVDGQIGILKGHVPLLTSLKIGLLRYQPTGGTEQDVVALMGGILETDGTHITVLANAAEKADEIDALRAEEAKKRAESLLNERNEKINVDRAQLSLARALTRLKVLHTLRTAKHR